MEGASRVPGADHARSQSFRGLPGLHIRARHGGDVAGRYIWLCACMVLALTATSAGASVRTVTQPVHRARTFVLPRGTTDVAVHWRGRPHAQVRVAFRRPGERFGS